MGHPLNNSGIYSPAAVEAAAAAAVPSNRWSHRCIECLRFEYRQAASHPNLSLRLAYTIALLASSLFLVAAALVFSLFEGIYDLGCHYFSIWFPEELPLASRVQTLDAPLQAIPQPASSSGRSPTSPYRSAEEISSMCARIKNLPKLPPKGRG